MSDMVRELFVHGLMRTGHPDLERFAEYLSRPARDGSLPCWGAAAAAAAQQFRTDDSLAALWRSLVRIGEQNALLAFLIVFQDHPKLLRKMLDEDLERLPVTVQRALLAMPKLSPLSPSHVCEITNEREAERVTNRIHRLLSVKTTAPQVDIDE